MSQHDKNPYEQKGMDCLSLEDGTDKLSRNFAHRLPIKRYVTSQKSEDLIYTAAEAWHYEFRYYTLMVTTCLIGRVNESKHE